MQEHLFAKREVTGGEGRKIQDQVTGIGQCRTGIRRTKSQGLKMQDRKMTNEI